MQTQTWCGVQARGCCGQDERVQERRTGAQLAPATGGLQTAHEAGAFEESRGVIARSFYSGSSRLLCSESPKESPNSKTEVGRADAGDPRQEVMAVRSRQVVWREGAGFEDYEDNVM